jgi:hypothetical protein
MCSVAASSFVFEEGPGLSMVGATCSEKDIWKARSIHITQLALDYGRRKTVKKPKYTKIGVE